VIFIHGILGTPDHFLPFLSLIPEDISVVNLLLDGHGKGVREFSRTSMAKWEAQVDAAVDAALAAHQKVFLVAHSLGSLLKS
jgi:pimeloyl-ACP methyl ester carboxylesterase